LSTDATARDYLDYYLDQPGEPQFAVMLEGPWGSGKSFFVDRYFKERFAKAKLKDPKAKEEIRVSLFGVRELGDVTSQIFAKAHPLLGGKALRTINFVASRLASLAGGSFDPKENAKLIEEVMTNLENRVLVFDDFERCPLPLVEVMGFINRFVEQDKLKVIVVAAEDEIDPNQKKEYFTRKEKLIGKTIRVGSDPGAVLDAFTAGLVNNEARDAIAANRDDALASFTSGGRPNFRSLRAILADYDRITGLADVSLRKSANAMGALLLYMLAVGTEYRRNGIDAEGLRTLTSDIALRGNFNNAPVSDERQRAGSFRDRYPMVNWRDPVVPPELLAGLFASGTIDVATLAAHLGQHPLVVGRAQVPEWRAMWSWYDMSEKEYRPVRDTYANQLATRTLVHPGQILHAAGTTIRLLGYGDDLLGGATPKAFFTSYVNELEKEGTLLASPELFGPGSGAYAGLGYNEEDNPDFLDIFELVRAAAYRSLERRMSLEAPVLLQRLKDDPSNASMLHEWGLAKQNYAGTAILHNIAVADMADLLLEDGKLKDRLLAALKERYDLGQHDCALDPEKPWLLALHAELTQRVARLPAPYRLLDERRLAHWFDNLLEWATPPALPKTPARSVKGSASKAASAAATRTRKK
jgi:hypothetical protein